MPRRVAHGGFVLYTWRTWHGMACMNASRNTYSKWDWSGGIITLFGWWLPSTGSTVDTNAPASAKALLGVARSIAAAAAMRCRDARCEACRDARCEACLGRKRTPVTREVAVELVHEAGVVVMLLRADHVRGLVVAIALRASRALKRALRSQGP